MTMITSLSSKIRNLFFFLLPLSYIVYIIYIRLILERSVRPLDIPFSKLQLFSTILIIVVLVFRIYFLLKKLEIIPEKEKKSAVVMWLLKKANGLSQHYNQIWIDFHRFFVAKNVKIHLLLHKLGTFLGKHRTPTFMLTIIMLFQVLPKVIVVSAFLVDLFVYNQFYYFYKVIGLLLLPLIYTALRAMLLQFYEDNSEFFSGFVTRTMIPVKNSKSFTIKYDFVEGYTPPSFVKDLDDFLTNHMFPIVGIEMTLFYYDACMKLYKIYWIFLFILILHLMGWSIILFNAIYL